MNIRHPKDLYEETKIYLQFRNSCRGKQAIDESFLAI